MARLKRFLKDLSGSTAIEYGLLVSLVSVALIGAVLMTGERTRALFEDLSFQLGTGEVASDVAPDIVMATRRLPQNPDHPTLWAQPFHLSNVPDGFPDIGGQEFSITGDGNPRMLIAGADPRVIQGPTNPQFDTNNYASSGTAFGSNQFHRILIDTPPPNTTHTVTLTVAGQTIQYQFTNIPY